MPTLKRQNHVERQPSLSMIAAMNSRILSSELEEESQKVRSMYESPEGPSLNWRDGRTSALGEVEKIHEDAGEEGKVEG